MSTTDKNEYDPSESALSEAIRKIRARAASRSTAELHGKEFVAGLRCAANIADEIAARHLSMSAIEHRKELEQTP